MISKKIDAQYKICIFGDGGVGKTTLINRFVSGKFSDSFKMTIGVDLYTKRLELDGKVTSLKIWDFAGDNQNQFRNLLPNYVLGAAGGIFMYDITRIHSIRNVDDWLKILLKYFKVGEERIPIMLVGGKSDLEEKRSVDVEYVEEVAKLYNFFDFMECSSITGQNIDEVFKSITKKMLKKSNLI